MTNCVSSCSVSRVVILPPCCNIILAQRTLPPVHQVINKL